MKKECTNETALQFDNCMREQIEGCGGCSWYIEKQHAIEPQIVNSNNTMSLMTFDKAKQMLRDVFDDMVVVTHWMPYVDGDYGMTLECMTQTEICLPFNNSKPIIKDLNVTWMYSNDALQKAIQIFSLMGWDSVEILCPKKAYPLMLKTPMSKNAVILIAPRIEST